MLKGIGKLRLIGIIISALWFVVFSVIAISSWNHKEIDRAYYYEQCLEQIPDVAKCKSLSAETRRAAFDDVAEDFLITGPAPIAVFWLAVWLWLGKNRSRRISDA